MNGLDVTVGEYRVMFCEDGIAVDRNGVAWRDCTGDNLVLSLAMEVNDLRARLQKVEASLKETRNRLAFHDGCSKYQVGDSCVIHRADEAIKPDD